MSQVFTHHIGHHLAEWFASGCGTLSGRLKHVQIDGESGSDGLGHSLPSTDGYNIYCILHRASNITHHCENAIVYHFAPDRFQRKSATRAKIKGVK